MKRFSSPLATAAWSAALVTACATAAGSPAGAGAAQQSPAQADSTREAARPPREAWPEVDVHAPADTVPRPPAVPSILPFGIVWAPSSPSEGSAFAVQALEPVGGREASGVQGEFAGLPVRFARLNGTWFALVAVPIGAAGEQDLTLRFAFEGGTTREQSTPIRVGARTWSRSQLSVAPRFTSPSDEALERIRRERVIIRSVLDSASPAWLVEGPFRPPRPLDVTSPYGQERVFNGEIQSRHTGLDLRGELGDAAHAAARGRVALTGDFYYSGNGVFLDHGLGVYTGYFHLSKILVSQGQIVEPGDLIGEVGATGRVTGAHLHWSLWVAGSSLDAASLLELPVP